MEPIDMLQTLLEPYSEENSYIRDEAALCGANEVIPYYLLDDE